MKYKIIYTQKIPQEVHNVDKYLVEASPYIALVLDPESELPTG